MSDGRQVMGYGQSMVVAGVPSPGMNNKVLDFERAAAGRPYRLPVTCHPSRIFTTNAHGGGRRPRG